MPIMAGRHTSVCIHPFARAAALVCGISGTLIGNCWPVLVLGYAAIVVPGVVFSKVGRNHRRFCAGVALPFFVSATIVWGIVVGDQPGGMRHRDVAAGVQFAFLMTVRLVLLGGITQWLLAAMPTDELLSTLTRWHVRGELLVIVLSTVAFGPEIVRLAEQVSMARHSRGLVRRRTLLIESTQVPTLLRPIIALLLRSAIRRGEVWRQRGLIDRLPCLGNVELNVAHITSVIYVCLAAMWLVVNMTIRFAGRT